MREFYHLVMLLAISNIVIQKDSLTDSQLKN